MLGINLSPIVKNLLLINVGIFIIANVINFEGVLDFMALRYFSASEFNVHQLITHMFMHGGFMHLLFNMFALFMFGPALENVWGPKRFLIFYLICGIGAALLYSGVNAYQYHEIRESISAYQQNPTPYAYEILVNKHFGSFERFPQFSEYFHQLPRTFKENPQDPTLISQTYQILTSFYELRINTPMIGASGAVFGILLGFGMLFPNTVLMLLFPPIPIKAKYFVIIYGLIELYGGVQSRPDDNVAHFAHLGGMLFGFILIKYWQRERNSFY